MRISCRMGDQYQRSPLQPTRGQEALIHSVSIQPTGEAANSSLKRSHTKPTSTMAHSLLAEGQGLRVEISRSSMLESLSSHFTRSSIHLQNSSAKALERSSFKTTHLWSTPRFEIRYQKMLIKRAQRGRHWSQILLLFNNPSKRIEVTKLFQQTQLMSLRLLLSLQSRIQAQSSWKFWALPS